MSEYNLKAKEFVPSWLKAKPAAAAAPAAAAPPANIPWKSPSPKPSNSASVSASTPTTNNAPPLPPPKRSHMNPNAIVFEPKFVAMPPLTQPPATAPIPQTVQWPATVTKPSPKLSAQATAITTKPIALAKTEEEIVAISKCSKLKVAAAIFIPGQKQHRRDVLLHGKPSPLTLQPLAEPLDTEMLLFDAWCLYCLSNSVTKEENYDPTLVFRIDSVATFWKTVNNLPEPTELSPPTTMYLFRDDINPKWEDPKNVAGGAWKLRIDRDKVDSIWLILACKTIGESWLKEHRNSVNGIVLKIRERAFFIEVWVTQKLPDFPTDLLSAIEHEVPGFVIDFYTHSEVQSAMKEAAAAAAAKNKKNAKGRRK